MEQITEEARAEGMELGEVKRRIDGKGTVIFTLGNGGTVRDTGKEIFFSSQDDKTQQVALMYAGKKWGKHFALEQGCIMRTPDGQSRMWETEPPQRQKEIER